MFVWDVGEVVIGEKWGGCLLIFLVCWLFLGVGNGVDGLRCFGLMSWVIRRRVMMVSVRYMCVFEGFCFWGFVILRVMLMLGCLSVGMFVVKFSVDDLFWGV